MSPSFPVILIMSHQSLPLQFYYSTSPQWYGSCGSAAQLSKGCIPCSRSPAGFYPHRCLFEYPWNSGQICGKVAGGGMILGTFSYKSKSGILLEVAERAKAANGRDKRCNGTAVDGSSSPCYGANKAERPKTAFRPYRLFSQWVTVYWRYMTPIHRLLLLGFPSAKNNKGSDGREQNQYNSNDDTRTARGTVFWIFG